MTADVAKRCLPESGSFALQTPFEIVQHLGTFESSFQLGQLRLSPTSLSQPFPNDLLGSFQQ